jgi:hypothetical protein
VHEDGEWLAELAGLHCELRRDGKHRIIHFWSEDRNLVRRILRVFQCTPERVTLEIQRFGRAKSGRLEILRADAPRPARRVSREKFRARFRRMLAEQFPDGKVASLTTAPDLEHSFSGAYSRGLLVERGKVWAVLGVSGAEDAAAVDGALTFGLLWLDGARESAGIRARSRAVQGLRLFLPSGSSRVSLQRLAALAPSAHVEVYEFSDATWGMERREAASSRTISSTAGPSCARCLRAELGNEAGQRPLKKEGKQPAEQDRFPGCVQKCLDNLDEKAAQRLQIGAINRRGTYATSRPCGRSGASTAARYAT